MWPRMNCSRHLVMTGVSAICQACCRWFFGDGMHVFRQAGMEACARDRLKIFVKTWENWSAQALGTFPDTPFGPVGWSWEQIDSEVVWLQTAVAWLQSVRRMCSALPPVQCCSVQLCWSVPWSWTAASVTDADWHYVDWRQEKELKIKLTLVATCDVIRRENAATAICTYMSTHS